MKTEELTNRVLLFALGKTTDLPLQGTNLAEFYLINKPISNKFFGSCKNRKFERFCGVAL